MSPWLVYLITRCDTISNNGALLAVVIFIASIILWICYIANYINYPDAACVPKLNCAAKMVTCLFVPFLLLATFIPTTKEAATIYVLPAIVNNQTIQKESSELYQLTKDYLNKIVRGDAPKIGDK